MTSALDAVLAQYAAGHLAEVLERIERAVYMAQQAGLVTEDPAFVELLRATAAAADLRARYSDEVKAGRAQLADLHGVLRIVVGHMKPMRTSTGSGYERHNEFPNGWNACLAQVAAAARSCAPAAAPRSHSPSPTAEAAGAPSPSDGGTP